jgi:hypothetical protein
MDATKTIPGFASLNPGYGMNLRLTITGRGLRAGNHDVMKKAFLPIVVKISALMFTIPIRFRTLLLSIQARGFACFQCQSVQ